MEKRFGVMSADGHCRLPHLPFDLWTKRLPRRFQDDAPRVVQRPDGTRQWVVEGQPWSGVGWAGVGRGRSIATPAPVCRRRLSPASSVRRTPDIAARTWTATGSTPSWSTAPTSKYGDQEPGTARRLRAGGQRLGTRALRRVERPLHHAAAAAVQTPEEAIAGAVAGGRIRAADGGHLRLGRRPGAGAAPDVGAGLGRRRRDRHAGQFARQPERRLAPDRGRGLGPRAAQPVPDAGRQLPDGDDGGTDERRRLFGHLRPPSRRALCPRRGWRRLGPVPVLAVRPRIRFRRAGDAASSSPTSRSREAERVRADARSSSPSRSRRRAAFGARPRSASAISCGPATSPASTARGRIRRRWAMLRPRRRSARRLSTSWSSRTR